MSGLPAENQASGSAQDSHSSTETLAYQQLAADTGHPARSSTPERDSASAPTDESGSPANAIRPRNLVGQCFDDLELLQELGRGGMGLVYKARQKSLDRLVAVKLLLADHYVDATRLARFHAEARAAASLTHTNIVQVYQVGACTLGHYFAMEYIDGKSLEAFIRKGNTSIAAATSVMAVVADAVHYAHGKGIVHRDLKPANIMIDRAKRPVVMDFGIAKFVGKTSLLTQQGVVMGTPAYMAPEQASGTPDDIGPRTDVYSLGAILYTLLTGRLPYEEETALKTVLKVIGPDMPMPVRRLRRGVPVDLDRIIMKCLNKKPADRFGDAQELAQAVRRFRTVKEEPAASTVERKNTASTMHADTPASVTLVAEATGKKLRLFNVVSVLGRASDCDVVVRASDVSKRHCQILFEEDGVVVEDLDSANGTFVNGARVRRQSLSDNDVLRIADHKFTVLIHPAP
jgi:serine/threonine protein kinase